MSSGIRYLTEVRSAETDWQTAFGAELGWLLHDGVIARLAESYERASYRAVGRSEAYVAEGLYEWHTAEKVAAIDPVIAEAMAAESCPYVGPCRGFLAWTMERSDDARRFGVSAGRAGRGLVIDLGSGGQRPKLLHTIAYGSVRVDLRRLWFLPSVDLVLKYNSDVLLFSDGPYLEHVRRTMQRVDGAPPRGGSHWPRPEISGDRRIEIWRYASSMCNGSASCWFE